MLRLYGPAANLDRVRPHEVGAVAQEIDAALFKRLGKRLGDAADHLLFAVDQRRPVELGLAHADMVDVGLVDLVQGVAGGHQHLFRGAAAIGAGAAKVAFLDHRHLHPCLSGRHGDAEAGIAAAQDQHIVAIGCHVLALPGRGRAFQCPRSIIAIDAAKGRGEALRQASGPHRPASRYHFKP
jgi:hypothetical protein